MPSRLRKSDGTYITGQELSEASLTAVADEVTDDDTTHAPTGNAVFDALALKLDADISGLDAATPVSADIFVFRTAGGVLKKVTLADLATAIDGELNP